MTLAARRGPRLRFPFRNSFLGEPDGEASAIAKRSVVVPPIGDTVFLTGNMMPAFTMKFERHDSSPGQRRETSGLTILKLSLSPYPCNTVAKSIGFGALSIRMDTFSTFWFRTGEIALRRGGSCVNCSRNQPKRRAS